MFSTYFLPYLSGSIAYPYRLISRNLNSGDLFSVLTFRYKDSLPIQETLNNVIIHRAKYLFSVSKGFISPLLGLRHLSLIRKADVVVLNLPNFEGLTVALLARLLGKKIIGFFCCEVDLGPTIWRRLIVLALNCSVRLQLLLCHNVIVPSEDYPKAYGWLNSFRHKVLCVLPQATKPSVKAETAERLKKLKGDKIWIGFCGRLSQEKGLDVLIDAIEKLDLTMPVEFVVAGPGGGQVSGEDDYCNHISEKLKRCHVPCRQFGVLDEDELWALFETLDVLALPSINRTEAFGIVQIEAMQCGTRVVASDLPGVRVPIKLSGLGRLARVGDALDLKEQIEKIILTLKERNKAEDAKLAQDIFDAKVSDKQWQSIIGIR